MLSERQGGGETEVKRSLWIEQTELFGLFQQHRGGVFRWLQAHPAEASEVMEGVIRVLTFTGWRTGEGSFKPRS